jgi:hypothetical protein
MLSLFFDSNAIWFTVPALLGTLLFSIKLILMLVLGDDAGVDVDAGDGGLGIGSEFISVQAFLALLMGFGWGGLGALKGFGWGLGASIGMGVVGAVIMMAILVITMRSMRSLSSSGNIALAALAGKTGDVTVAIPASGKGQGEVRLIVGDRERICYATTDGNELPSRSRVRVARVNADNTVTVEPV